MALISRLDTLLKLSISDTGPTALQPDNKVAGRLQGCPKAMFSVLYRVWGLGLGARGLGFGVLSNSAGSRGQVCSRALHVRTITYFTYHNTP